MFAPSTVDPYAITLEWPAPPDRGAPLAWERDEVFHHLGAQYQIVRELGRGSMGVVFLARDIPLHRLVAIKVLRHELASSAEHRDRFRREARMTARLSHSHIVPVHSFGEMGDFVYLVMKYVHGESLAQRLQREGKLPARDVQRILKDLALALVSAHGDGVVHRDLKPENIMLDATTGHAMLTDFGVALLKSLDPRRDESRRVFGTPLYMSPEQAAGELDIDGRSDVYSLGVLGYHMLTGRPPFEARTLQALAAQHVAQAPAPLDALSPSSAKLNAVVMRCLAKLRHDRFAGARELGEALTLRPERRWWFTRVS